MTACAVTRRVAGLVLVAGAALASESPGIAPVDDAAPEAPAAMSVAAAETAVAAALAAVQEIRGLAFERTVPVKVVGDDEVREHALDRLSQFYDEDTLRGQQRAYVHLGLLPEGTVLLDEYLAVLEEQAGGFYDPEREEFYLLDDMPAAIAPMLAAHELTHALEDQHFDLDGRIREAFPNDDRVFAVSAVHEGSAMLVMSLYMVKAMADGSLAPGAIRELSENEASRAEALLSMPPALRRPFLGPYVLGLAFLVRGNLMALAGGYPVEDVDGCMATGPVSSEQILHPEKYWDPDERDEPTPVAPFDARKALGRRWKRSASGVLGELVAGVMVGAPTPTDLSSAGLPDAAQWTNGAAAGWDGDRWELWTRGDAAVTLFSSVWDTPEDAREFHEALDPRDGVVARVSGRRVAMVAGDTRGRENRLLALLLRD